MLGLMQDWPLLCHRVIDHAARYHADRPVISRSIEGPIHTTNYAEIRARALKVAQRLDRDGIRLGDRVATLAWNTWRHLEAWYGILGIGGVYHTVNPRLFPEQIVWIVNHAEDRILFTDLTFVPLLEKLADKLPTIERYIVLTDAAHMPRTSLRNAVAYEKWLAGADGASPGNLDENTAAGMLLHPGTTEIPRAWCIPTAPMSSRAGLEPARHARHIVPGHRAAGGAAVSCQRVVARLLGPDVRRQPGPAGNEARRRVDL